MKQETNWLKERLPAYLTTKFYRGVPLPLYCFKVTQSLGEGASFVFFIEVPAGSKQAAVEEVELMLNPEFEIEELEFLGVDWKRRKQDGT